MPRAWRRFSLDWDAPRGEHRVRVRAHDATGRGQGTDPPWNRSGFTNNADQGVAVLVADA